MREELHDLVLNDEHARIIATDLCFTDWLIWMNDNQVETYIRLLRENRGAQVLREFGYFEKNYTSTHNI